MCAVQEVLHQAVLIIMRARVPAVVEGVMAEVIPLPLQHRDTYSQDTEQNSPPAALQKYGASSSASLLLWPLESSWRHIAPQQRGGLCSVDELAQARAGTLDESAYAETDRALRSQQP